MRDLDCLFGTRPVHRTSRCMYMNDLPISDLLIRLHHPISMSCGRPDTAISPSPSPLSTRIHVATRQDERTSPKSSPPIPCPFPTPCPKPRTPQSLSLAHV